MQGLGDTVFQRACLRDFPRLAYVETSWPQLLDDLPNVRCCPPTRDLHLRTQSLNAAREYAWHTPPLGIETLSPMHHSHHPPGVTHLSDVEHSFGLPSGKRVTYDLPDFGMSPLAHERVAVVYLSVVYPGVVKGWHYHRKQTDHFVFVKGMAKVVLYDNRENSKTRGEINEFFMGENNPILLVIPPFVLHGMKGIGVEPAYLINTPTEHYVYEEPDEFRVAPHSPEVPYDWNRKDG